jgi:predicted Zn-ribbon and HTH transcriptional regulator
MLSTMMENNHVERKLLRCRRCGYAWMERPKGPPKRCPRCKSERWNTREPYHPGMVPKFVRQHT